MLSDYDTVDFARPRAIGWTLSVHILLHVVSVYAQFPGDPTNGQPLALRLPYRPPSRCLKGCGLPQTRSHGLANSSGAIAEGLVRRFLSSGMASIPLAFILHATYIVTYVFILATFTPTPAVTVWRLHSTDRSACWSLGFVL